MRINCRKRNKVKRNNAVIIRRVINEERTRKKNIKIKRRERKAFKKISGLSQEREKREKREREREREILFC